MSDGTFPHVAAFLLYWGVYPYRYLILLYIMRELRDGVVHIT